jgi:hypothetical protein
MPVISWVSHAWMPLAHINTFRGSSICIFALFSRFFQHRCCAQKSSQNFPLFFFGRHEPWHARRVPTRRRSLRECRRGPWLPVVSNCSHQCHIMHYCIGIEKNGITGTTASDRTFGHVPSLAPDTVAEARHPKSNSGVMRSWHLPMSFYKCVYERTCAKVRKAQRWHPWILLQPCVISRLSWLSGINDICYATGTVVH